MSSASPAPSRDRGTAGSRTGDLRSLACGATCQRLPAIRTHFDAHQAQGEGGGTPKDAGLVEIVPALQDPDDVIVVVNVPADFAVGCVL